MPGCKIHLSQSRTPNEKMQKRKQTHGTNRIQKCVKGIANMFEMSNIPVIPNTSGCQSPQEVKMTVDNDNDYLTPVFQHQAQKWHELFCRYYRVWNFLETHYKCWWLILHLRAYINYLSNKCFLYFMTLPWVYKKKRHRLRTDLPVTGPHRFLHENATLKLYSVMNQVRFSSATPGLLSLEQL